MWRFSRSATQQDADHNFGSDEQRSMFALTFKQKRSRGHERLLSFWLILLLLGVERQFRVAPAFLIDRRYL